eukprot:TRINITY_DN7057_c0_g1_i1.p1 TRINITY_DN7057_c0_g1~~TRINITY_DN7057_c0_g1_i1.p1  ORF type:complete len:290 (-),score=14.11 TRINITY_DN7057_c0_g1_i1:282-1073(-)
MVVFDMTLVDTDQRIRAWFTTGANLASSVWAVVQRIGILLSDAFLITYACVALREDWSHSCDETLHLYALLCIVLSMLDIFLEMLRCSSESNLNRLQTEFKPQGVTNSLSPFVEEGLLVNHDVEPLGQAHAEGTAAQNNVVGSANISGGALGLGVRQEREMSRKRTADLHLWSVIFSSLVALIFAMFSAHDEDCAENVSSLYAYIQTFTYVYTVRISVIILLVCCRTIKDYEDTAATIWAGRTVVPTGDESRGCPPLAELRSF